MDKLCEDKMESEKRIEALTEQVMRVLWEEGPFRDAAEFSLVRYRVMSKPENRDASGDQFIEAYKRGVQRLAAAKARVQKEERASYCTYCPKNPKSYELLWENEKKEKN